VIVILVRTIKLFKVTFSSALQKARVFSLLVAFTLFKAGANPSGEPGKIGSGLASKY